MDMTIRVREEGQWGYSVYINGEIVLECLGEDEIKSATIGELMKIAKEDELI